MLDISNIYLFFKGAIYKSEYRRMFRKWRGDSRVRLIGRVWTLRVVHFDINMLRENNFSDTFTYQARQERSRCSEVRRYTPARIICRETVFVFFSSLLSSSGRRRVPCTASGHQSLGRLSHGVYISDRFEDSRIAPLTVVS